ncbi:MAG: rRNA maturation RNAse YbeY, partial [Candidatus Binataceae bacterium]
MAVELRCEAARGRGYAATMRRDAESLMRLLRLEGCELSLLIVGDRAMRKLDRRYRGKDRPTDVLSFSQLEEGPAGAAQRPAALPRGRSGPALAARLLVAQALACG